SSDASPPYSLTASTTLGHAAQPIASQSGIRPSTGRRSRAASSTRTRAESIRQMTGANTPNGGPLNQSGRRSNGCGSERADVLRLRALLALGDVEFHPLILVEAAEA